MATVAQLRSELSTLKSATGALIARNVALASENAELKVNPVPDDVITEIRETTAAVNAALEAE